MTSKRPIRVIQFGGGVFLRGFFDWMLQKANDSGVMDADAYIVRSRTRGIDPLAAHDYRYTQICRDGAHCEVTRIDCIAGSVDASQDRAGFEALAVLDTVEVVVSNTTEAGITYQTCPPPTEALPETYPAKLAHLLWLRYRAGLKGLLVVPCELIEHNGDTLRDAVLQHGRDWDLGEGFAEYVNRQCRFCNTLVDRIVSGKPDSERLPEIPWEESEYNESEYFHLFVIEGEEDSRLPFAKIGLNVKWVEDITPYRTLKVRILNGAHTSTVPYALTKGVATVGEFMKHPTLRAHLEACVFDEILPTLDFDAAEARAYANEVLSRFENPYLCHYCSAIAQNSTSKFRVRVLPSMRAYRERFGKMPPHLTLALAKLIALYRTDPPREEESALAAMCTQSTEALLQNTALWGEDLSAWTEEVLSYEHADS